MVDFLQWIGAVGGIGAVFAVLMFSVYRQTTKQMSEDRRYMEDRLTSVLDAYNKVTQENIGIQREVLTYLKAKNGSG